ncbi:MAG: hypothetical protein JWQ35_91 [Bacteriovoracaceae bacterium]|nr:hypothetical protein [Bacteriovoracaceae bacterium]
MSSVSVLFPYKPDHGRRDELFNWVKRRWQSLLPEVEICVGETSDVPFNRSRAINLAAEKASGDTLIIADTDTAFEKDAILEGIAQVNQEKCWFLPYRDYCRLDEPTTNRLLKENPDIEVTQKDFTPMEITKGYVSGAVILTRDAFRAVGGFDDRFQDWGGEDEAFFHAAKTLWSKVKRVDGSVFHLWHPPARQATERDGKYLDNVWLLLKYQHAEGSPLVMKTLCRV